MPAAIKRSKAEGMIELGRLKEYAGGGAVRKRRKKRKEEEKERTKLALLF